MLTGFEDKTGELTEEEKKLLPLFIKGFRSKFGCKNKISNRELRLRLKEKTKIEVSDVRVRKIVNHIRVNKLIVNLISDSKGYWIASNEEEVSKYIESLNQRINEISRVRNSFL